MKHYDEIEFEEGDEVKFIIGFLAVCLAITAAYAWLIGAI